MSYPHQYGPNPYPNVPQNARITSGTYNNIQPNYMAPTPYPNFGMSSGQNLTINTGPKMGPIARGPIPGFVSVAEPPTMAYVPPPRQPLKFEFRPVNQNTYANLYSIIQTVDILQDEYSNGSISESDLDSKMSILKQQYLVMKQVAGFSDQNVRDFAEECGLECFLALKILAPEQKATVQPSMVASLQDASEFGQAYVNLINNVDIGPYNMDKVRLAFNDFRFPLERLGYLNKSMNIRSKVQYWSEFFARMHPSDIVSPPDIKRYRDDMSNIYETVKTL